MTTTSPDDQSSSTPPPITILHCWSSPRSRSTALLYSFEARNKNLFTRCIAIDEPLYRRDILERNLSRPYRERLLRDASIPGEEEEEEEWRWERERKGLHKRILEAISELQSWRPSTTSATNDDSTTKTNRVIFIKHMAKHSYLYNFRTNCERGIIPNDDETTTTTIYPPNVTQRHILLLRDPLSVISSWAHRGSDGSFPPESAHLHSLEEVGIVQILTVYSTLSCCNSKDDPPVIILNSNDVEAYPVEAFGKLCDKVGITYTNEMIRWKRGWKDCDGPWAKWWYMSVHSSIGWMNGRHLHSSKEDEEDNVDEGGEFKAKKKYKTLDSEFIPILRASLPVYEYLNTLALDIAPSSFSTLSFYEDPRNEHVLYYVGCKLKHKEGGAGRLLPRDMTGVSPFDSAVQGGDACCWEGLRLCKGKILSLDQHLRRLFATAKALGFYMAGNDGVGFERVHTEEDVKEALWRTLAANGMRDHANVRVTLTRGEKCTSSMNPHFNTYGTTLLILAEWKPTHDATTCDNTRGVSLVSASQHHNPSSTLDSNLHPNNLHNNILPKIQANVSNAADAIMMDRNGFVSQTNTSNIFMVDYSGRLLTPHADACCLPGVTRDTVMYIAKHDLGMDVVERNISLAEFYVAEEVFTVGAMGELNLVTCIDGRMIGCGGDVGAVTKRLQEVYDKLPNREGWATEIPPFV